MSRALWAYAQAALLLVTLLCTPVAAGTARPLPEPGLWNPHAVLDNSRVHVAPLHHHRR